MDASLVNAQQVARGASRGACGAWARSLRLLGLTLGLQANAVTYGAAVDRVTSDRWPQAVQLLHVGLFRALQATVVTYTSIMALAILWQQSLQMLHQHVLSSLDLVTCNSALHAFQGASAWLQAIHTLKLMEVRRVRPGGISLSLALTAQKGVILELLKDMRLRHLEADLMTYNAAISVLDKAGKWEEALSLLALALRKKMPADVLTYASAMCVCENAGEWVQSLMPSSILGELGSSAFFCNPFVLTGSQGCLVETGV
eukprot:g586.t1